MQPTPLAAAERADGSELGVAVEPELLHQDHVGQGRFSLVAGHGLAHTLRQVEAATQLVVVADLDRRAALDLTAGGRQPPGDQIQQGRLAGAVGPDDADAVARLERDVDASEHRRAVGPAERDVAGLDALRAQPLRAHRELQ